MKTMLLTGLATEQSFEEGGEPKYFLVFNNGELRVPTTEAAAQIIVQEMYGSSKSTSFTTEEIEEERVTRHAERDAENTYQDEDGVDQV